MKKIVPGKLAIGAHKIGEEPLYWDTFSSLMTDRVARYAFGVQLSRGGYFIVDGEKEKTRAIDDIRDVDFQFSEDGEAYAHNIPGNKGVVLNGERIAGRGSSGIWLHRDAAHWTYRKTKRWVGCILHSSAGVQPFGLCGYEGFTPNGRHLLYFDDQSRLICDGRILFPGTISEYKAANRRPYASWLGEPGGKEVTYAYLLGRRREALPAYYEALTFAVSRDHARYMYGAAEEKIEDGDGNFTGEQFLYLDGERQQGSWLEVLFWENHFSSDNRRWTYLAKDHDFREHAFVDGKEIGVFEECRCNGFSPGGSRHGFLAYFSASGQRKTKRDDLVAYPVRAAAVIDGRTYEAEDSIRYASLTFSPNDRHFAYIGVRDESEEAVWSNYKVYLDGKVVTEHEFCFGSTHIDQERAPIFSADSTRLYYFSIDGGALYLHVLKVE